MLRIKKVLSMMKATHWTTWAGANLDNMDEISEEYQAGRLRSPGRGMAVPRSHGTGRMIKATNP